MSAVELVAMICYQSDKKKEIYSYEAHLLMTGALQGPLI
jgi:hypothetical protein